MRAFAAKRGLEFHAISSATGEGITELVRGMADALDRIPKPAVVEAPDQQTPENPAPHISSEPETVDPDPHREER